MKRIASLALAITFFFIACNDKKSKETTTDTTDSTGKVTTDPNAGQAIIEELSKLTPATADQMKALLPATLVGIAKTGENVREVDGTMFSTANYKKDDTTYMSLSFYDCAGNAGAGVYNMHLQNLSNPPEQEEKKYRKTIDFNGGKAIEACDMLYKNCSLIYLGGNRYLVVIEETNLDGAATLKQAVGELKYK